MKFLCPSCKAKYQIADEKVIGRTVKMKCRQCGHVIEINEASMVSSGPSIAPNALPISSAPTASPPLVRPVTVPGPTTIKGAPPKPVRSPTPPTGLTAVRKPPEAVKPEVAKPVAPAPRPATSVVGTSRSLGATESRAATRTGAAESAVPRPAFERKPQAVVTPTTERKSQPHGPPPSERKSQPHGPPPSEHKSQPHGPPPSERKSQPQAVGLGVKRGPTVGGTSSIGKVGRLPGVSETLATSLGAVASTTKPDPLAGAFAKAVEHTPTEAVEHQLAGDEWYVSIGEQPVGPIRLTEIRDRATKGEILLDCLVWRDGFEDWRPLTAFPELVAVVEDGIACARSLAPPPSPSIEPFTLPKQRLVATLDAAPIATAIVQPRAGDIAPIVATVATPQVQTAARHLDEEPLEVAGLSKQKIPLAAWFAVLMALVLGVTLGVVFIKPEPPKQIIKYVEVPAKQANVAANSPATVGSEQVAVGDAVANDVNEERQVSNTGARKATTTANGVAAEPSAVASAAALQGLKGLSGLRGLGPQGGPQANGASVSGGASQLDSATLSKTVSRYTPSVKRSCWQPALDMRTPDAPPTARVTATITVGPNGRVQNVTTSGDPKGYRGLATCIQTRVRNWEFPPAGGTTEFNVPFVFAAQ